jgi:hypothetical protein
MAGYAFANPPYVLTAAKGNRTFWKQKSPIDLDPLDTGTIWYQIVVPYGTRRGADDREVAYAG